MVHPRSNSLFTPSLFHTDGYDLVASRQPDIVSLNASTIVETDELISSLGGSLDDSTEYVITTGDDVRTVDHLMPVQTSNETDRIAPDSINNAWVTRRDHDEDSQIAIPDRSIEQTLGDVGVEAQMCIPAEMIGLDSPISDPDPEHTISLLPDLITPECLSIVSDDRDTEPSLTVLGECNDSPRFLTMPSSTLQGATASNRVEAEALPPAPSPAEESLTCHEALNLPSPLFL
ncbi:MAG: hypothetical protein EAZ61_11525 [Oscillatoriales cyanobacterium]|nr:MAG: hypothetical protein EAZ61_11525 [Oscillatoriales cyanobacterium]